MRDLEDSDGKDGNEVFHGRREFQGDELSLVKGWRSRMGFRRCGLKMWG